MSLTASALHSAWAADRNAVVIAVVYLLVPYLTPPLPDSRSGVLLLLALATLGVVVWRVLRVGRSPPVPGRQTSA